MNTKTPATKAVKKSVKKNVKSAGNPEQVAIDRKAYRTGSHTPKARTAGR
jgi:hypothetical protein